MSIEILYQDESLIAVNKPSGLLVHRSRESSDQRFLLQELRNQIGAHVFPVHRLDRPVSGVMVLALSPEAAALLQASLAGPTTLKRYIAVTRGGAPEQGIIDRPLTHENGMKQEAVTRFEKLAELEDFSCLRIEIESGRKHQIRRHLSHIKHQILGDTVYGKGGINRMCRERYGLQRIFLHSSVLRCPHPTTQKVLQLRAPLAPELQDCLTKMTENKSLLERILKDHG